MIFNRFRDSLTCTLMCILLSATPRAFGEVTAPEPDHGIEFATQPAARIAYRTHTGPYWRLGKAFAEVGVVLDGLPSAGPMFGRYLDDPSEVTAGELRTQVGFFLPDDVDPPSAYETETIPEHEAAVLRVNGPYGMSRKHVALMRAWINANGKSDSTEVMEVYPSRSGLAEFELRIPTRMLESGETEPVAQAEPVEPVENEPLAKLLADREFERAARVIVPLQNRLHGTQADWLVDVVDRLKVIRAIVSSKYGEDGNDVAALVVPIVHRGGRIMVDGASSKRSGSVAVLANQQIRGQILKDLDAVIVRAHLKTVDAPALFEQLVELVERIGHVVAPEQAGEAPTAPNTHLENR